MIRSNGFVVNIVPDSDTTFLRLHIENTPDAYRDQTQVPGLDRFCRAFEDVTGWSLKAVEQPPATADFPWSVPADTEASGFMLQPTLPARTGVPTREGVIRPPQLGHARQLAEALVEIVQELQQTRQALRECEAELAAGVPVAARRDEEAHLALRLESILQGGALAIGCQAAAVYMLDEATTELEMRSSWGLPHRRLLDAKRPLRGSVADLEALLGHAVVIHDAHLVPRWKIPEAYAAAICVPISSPTEPLGTLWLFAEHVTDFTAEQTTLAEIIAGRISAELQREALLSECVNSKQVDRQLVHAAQWQQNHHPNVTPLLDDWNLVGWTSESPVLNAGFFDWFCPRDGSLAVILGHGEGPMIQAALTAATLQSSLRSHAEHLQDAQALIGQVNETLWNISAGGSFASAFFGRIDPETGRLEFCTAGHTGALLVGSKGIETLADSSAPLGSEPDYGYRSRSVQLAPGDHLVLFKPTPNRTNRDFTNQDPAVGDLACGHLAGGDLPGGVPSTVMTPQSLAARLAATVAEEDDILDAVCTAVHELAPNADHALLIVQRRASHGH